MGGISPVLLRALCLILCLCGFITIVQGYDFEGLALCVVMASSVQGWEAP